MWVTGVIWAGHARTERNWGELRKNLTGSFAKPSLGGFIPQTPPRASVSLPSWEVRGAFFICLGHSFVPLVLRGIGLG